MIGEGSCLLAKLTRERRVEEPAGWGSRRVGEGFSFGKLMKDCDLPGTACCEANVGDFDTERIQN